MTANSDVLSISIPRTEAHVIRHFQERMPYGLFVPDVPISPSRLPPRLGHTGRQHQPFLGLTMAAGALSDSRDAVGAAGAPIFRAKPPRGGDRIQ
jgi:hypothetical protein